MRKIAHDRGEDVALRDLRPQPDLERELPASPGSSLFRPITAITLDHGGLGDAVYS